MVSAPTFPRPSRWSWRARVDEAIFTRVAGENAFAIRDRIHLTPGPRWFPPDAVIRRVHDNTSMYPGGVLVGMRWVARASRPAGPIPVPG